MFKPNQYSTRTQMILAFLAIYIIWGSTYMAIKVAIDTVPPFMMTAARFLVAGLGMYAVLRMTGTSRPTLRNWVECSLIGTLLLAFGTGGVVIAEKYVPTGMVSLLVAMVPVYVAVLEHISKGMPNKKTLLGLLLGTVGIVVLIGPNSLMGHSSINWMGVGAVLLGSFSWAAGSVYSRKAQLPSSMMLSTAMQMICGGLVLALISVATGEHTAVEVSKISLNSVLAFVYLIVFGSLVGFSAYVWLLKNVSPSKVSTYAYVNPIIAVFLGWAMAGEQVTMQTFFAAAAILPAVWLITAGGAKPKLVEAKIYASADRR